MKYLAALLILLPVTAGAEMLVFGGVGLGLGSMQMQGVNGGTNSKFSTQGYLGEAGLDFKFGGTSGLRLSAEAGRSTANNSYANRTFMEMGSLSYYAANAGMYFGKFAIGGGMRDSSATVKSLSTDSTGYLESKYKGMIPFGYASLSLDFDKRFRGTLEAQYLTGKLKGESSTLSEVKYQEFSAGFRFFVLFD